MKLLKELKLYRMEEIDGEDDDFSDDFDSYEQDDDFDNFDGEEELEPAASGPDPEEQDLESSEMDDEFSMDDDDLLGDEGEEEFDDEFSDEDDEFSMDDEDLLGDEGEEEFDDEFDDELSDDEETDQNYQGNIRSIPGTFLVYKRQAEDSTFEELWLYNVGKDIKHEMNLRRAILNGTDISPQTGKSKDNKQTAKITSMGNVQFLNVFGIPN